ncbi:MAG: hypothetical protein DRH20_02065 [Deltaproteobacteria bacterium]|nr:MAG: hypothetical protein DRH20_02065 [Deltaproteobacteria bacterium]
MVLSLMRKHAKSWLIKFLIAIIALVFIFYFGYSFTSRRAVKVAQVNDEVITGLEFQKTYRDMLEALQRQYRDMWNDNLIRTFDLKGKAFNTLVEQKLINQEARRLGFEITEDELKQTIMNYRAFQVNNQFDVGRYRAILSRNGMKPEDFEDSMAQELLRRKLREFLLTFSPVTEKESWSHFTFANEKVQIAYILFRPESFKKSVKVTEEELASFFKQHVENYRVPEKIKVSYLELDPKDFEDKVAIDDQRIREYYEYNIETFREKERVRARHILFRLKEGAEKSEEERVRKKAESVLKQAREGEDFAELARKYSEGPTGPKGGDLGYFQRGTMVKAFEEAAFGLKKGQVSDLVRTPFGYHIIKVEDVKKARTKPLEEVREQVKKILVRNAAAELAHEKGLTLMDQMPYDVDLDAYAAEHGIKAKTSAPFSKDEPIPGVGGTAKLRESLFALEKRETSDLIEQGGKFYIFQVVERIPSFLPKLATVRKDVEGDCVSERAAAAAQKAARGFLEKVRAGGDWETLAKEQGLKPVKTGFVGRQGGVPGIGAAGELQETAFKLGAERRYPDRVFPTPRGSYVIRWEAYQPPDKEKYAKEKVRFEQMLSQAKQSNLFRRWLEALKGVAHIEVLAPEILNQPRG